MCLSVPSPHSEQDYNEHEWMLCVNQVVIFKDPVGQSPRAFDVRFSARPQGIGEGEHDRQLNIERRRETRTVHITIE